MQNIYNSTYTHQHLASQRNSIYSTIWTLHFQLLPCTWTLDATNIFEILTQTQFKVIFCSYSLPTSAPSTRPRSTQYVGRWWHHDSAVAAVNPCPVSVGWLYSTSAVGYTDQQTSRLYRPVSVVSHLCSNSTCPCVSNLSNLFVCNVCGFWPFER